MNTLQLEKRKFLYCDAGTSDKVYEVALFSELTPVKDLSNYHVVTSFGPRTAKSLTSKVKISTKDRREANKIYDSSVYQKMKHYRIADFTRSPSIPMKFKGLKIDKTIRKYEELDDEISKRKKASMANFVPELLEI